MKRYLTATEATELMGVSSATLYAYVSRGLIRSEIASKKSREHRYLAQDVQALADRKAQRHDPTLAAQEALHWGTPILNSALTLITESALYYRGQDVTELAQTRTFEDIAALLWMDQDEIPASLFDASIAHLLPDSVLLDAADTGITAMELTLIIAGSLDLAAYTLTPQAVIQAGARILRLLTYALTRNPVHGSSIAAALAQAWGVHPAATRLLDAALILCADHELNASSFTTRVIASTEATPYAVVSGGLAALRGFKHGGQTRRVAAFLREVDRGDTIPDIIRVWLQRGDSIPGFGHRLYPHGDPRAKTLCVLMEQLNPGDKALDLSKQVADQMQQATGEAPTIDFALTTLELTLNLPADSALALFALGRTAGWIGHAIEQYSTRQLIRPRAKYVGRLPEG